MPNFGAGSATANKKWAHSGKSYQEVRSVLDPGPRIRYRCLDVVEFEGLLHKRSPVIYPEALWRYLILSPPGGSSHQGWVSSWKYTGDPVPSFKSNITKSQWPHFSSPKFHILLTDSSKVRNFERYNSVRIKNGVKWGRTSYYLSVRSCSANFSLG